MMITLMDHPPKKNLKGQYEQIVNKLRKPTSWLYIKGGQEIELRASRTNTVILDFSS